MRVHLGAEPISVDALIAEVQHGGAGAVALFLGAVRDENDGHPVTRLEYEAYAAMAIAEMNRIREELEAALPVRLAAHHRTGLLEVGELAVVCAASSAHRGEAFVACRRMIDAIKERVPIWKREYGPDGPYWIGWRDARCHEEGGHAHEGHTHDGGLKAR